MLTRLVRALRREDRRDEKLERARVVERALRVGVGAASIGGGWLRRAASSPRTSPGASAASRGHSTARRCIRASQRVRHGRRRGLVAALLDWQRQHFGTTVASRIAGVCDSRGSSSRCPRRRAAPRHADDPAHVGPPRPRPSRRRPGGRGTSARASRASRRRSRRSAPRAPVAASATPATRSRARRSRRSRSPGAGDGRPDRRGDEPDGIRRDGRRQPRVRLRRWSGWRSRGGRRSSRFCRPTP